MKVTEQLIDKVNGALESIRPFLQADGGDIELIHISEEMKVMVKLVGTCGTCSMSTMTMKAGVEESIKRLAPEIISVEAVSTEF